ncbi:MAG: site-specific DNA-methyltransferase [Sedimentisphaeraceae bacterium JB056]
MPTLNWIGKEAVVNHHNEVPFRLLKRDNRLSFGEPDSGNLLVQGDNLEALKALLPYYAGKVKCIYIDPPYNTGNENWVYNDNVNSTEIKKWLGKVVGKKGEDLSRSDKWLCMMYPRLALLKDFLKDDGAIFVSIDDDEGHYLKVLLDEIFGRQNFVSNVIWQKKFSPQNDAKWLSDSHDHILIYAKNKEIWRPNLLPRTAEMDKRYKNPDNDSRGAWTSGDLSVKTYSSETDYPIKTPSGRIVNPPQGYCWRVSKEKFQEMVDDDRIYFGKDGSNVPRIKRFLTDVKQGMTSTTIWFHNEVGHNQEAKQELKKISEDGASIFDTPKPTKLIERIIQLSCGKDDIILDSFAGSGATGHSVLKMNKDGGNRKFILVEIEPNVCSEITRSRLKFAIDGYTYSQKNKVVEVEGTGGGFCYVELGSTLFDSEGQIRDEVSFNELARHVYFTETGEPLPKQLKKSSPLIGVYKDTGIYLLYNGILKDKRVNGGNVLTGKVLDILPPHDGLRVIYGNACRLSSKRLQSEGIVFKQTPYEIRIN